MAGDEVHAGVGAAAALLVEVAGAGEAEGQLGHLAPVPLPVAPDGIAILAVPFRPSRREVPDLIAPLAQVPRLGDQLDLRDHRVLVDHVEEGGQPVDVVQLPGEGRREVEAEAVDVHLEHPVAQAVHEELERARVPHVEGVAAPGVVLVVARGVGDEPVVGGVVDAAEGQGRPEVVALRRVVVHDVEDDLDPGLVEGLHHGLELAHLLAAGPLAREARVGGEISDGVVAPVVREPPLHLEPLGHGVVHGQELHRGDPEPGQVLDGGRRAEASVGAPELGRHLPVPGGEPLDVQLVDHRPVPGRAGRPVVAPAEGGVDHHAGRHEGRAVPAVQLEVGVGPGSDAVAAHRVVPAHRAVDRLGVRIDQQLGRIEAVARRRLPGAMHAIAVELAGPDLGQVGVPDLVGALDEADAGRLPMGLAALEQAQLHRRRVLAEQGEVDAGSVPGGAERVGAPRARPHHGHGERLMARRPAAGGGRRAGGASGRPSGSGRATARGSAWTPPPLPRLLPP